MSELIEKNKNLWLRIKRFIVILFSASKVELLFLFAVSIIAGAISPIAIWLSKYLIDELALTLETQQIRRVLIALIGILFGLDIIQTMVNRISEIIQTHFSDKVSVYITDQVLNKVAELPMTYFDDSSTYNKVRLAIQETPDRCLAIIMGGEGIIVSLIQLIGVLTILIRLHWLIGVIPVAFLVPLFGMRFKVSKAWFLIQGNRAEKMRYTDELKSILLKNENIKELRLFDISKPLSKRIVQLQEKINRDNFLNSKKYAKINILTVLLNGAYSFVIKLWIIIIGLRKNYAIGSVSMYINAVDMYGNLIDGALQQLSLISEQLLYIGYICEIDEMSVDESEGLIELTDSIHRIEFKDVSFKYQNSEQYVIKNISMILEQNNVYAFVGTNGTGKTTLLKLLMKIYLPSAGEIYVNDINIIQISGKSLRKRMTAVFQDFIKYPFTISENICLSKTRLAYLKMLKVTKDIGIDKEIAKMPKGYDTQLQCEWDKGVDISGGQWQKIAIARGLYKETDMYMFDEPFAWVDQIAKDSILEKVTKLRNEKIIVLISHQFDVMPMVDKIIVMEKGEIIETGTHDELIHKKGLYARLAKLGESN